MMTFYVLFDIYINTIMKKIITLLLLLLISACSSKNGTQNDIKQAQSKICSNVQGAAALYWDFAHSLPIPLTEVPLIKNPGQQFVHSLSPLLGFTIPKGFTAYEVTDVQTATIGVNVVRDDNAVVFRWIPNTQTVGQVSSTTLIANEINNMFSIFGFSGSPNVLCSTTDSNIFEGIPSQFSARLLEFNGITAQVWVRSTYIAGVTFSAISLTVAPSNEYDQQVMETFLPINYQLFVGRDGGFIDNDGDGFPAYEDPDDNDPNVPINRG